MFFETTLEQDSRDAGVDTPVVVGLTTNHCVSTTVRITGATMERPGLQVVLQHLVRGGVKALVIEDVDRLSRDAEHLQYVVKIFRLHRVRGAYGRCWQD